MLSSLSKIRWRVVFAWVLQFVTLGGAAAAFILEGQSVLWFGLAFVALINLRLEHLIAALMSARSDYEESEDD